MFSLKRLIISSLSRKTKVADSCNGILPNMQMTSERFQRLSIASDRSNPMESGEHQMESRRYLGNSTSRSTIEIPIYYYQQQQEQQRQHHHQQQQQTPQQFLYSGSDGDGDDSTKIPMPTGLRPITYTQTSGISPQNPYWFNSNDVMTDSITREYQTSSSSGQKSLINFNTSFIQQQDSTHLPEDYCGQRRQLSEPNSRLKHRYSHCLSTDINGKCCPTHHNPQYYHQPRRHDNITTKMNMTGGHFSTTVSYTPSLIDLRWPTKFKSLHRKDSNEQLCVNSSPYSFIDNNNNNSNNKDGQNFQNSNYAYPPTTFNVCEAGTMPSHQGYHDKSSPMDPYYTQYHVQPYPIYHYAHEQQPYQNPSNNNNGNDSEKLKEYTPWNRNDTSPGARSCSTYDIPFPVYYNYDNHRMKGNSTLSVEKEHIVPLPVTLCPSSTSIMTATTTTNSNRLQTGCVSEGLTPDILDIPNTNNNNNDNNNGMGNGNTNHGKYIQLSSKFGRRLTEFGEDLICPESPIHVQRKTGITGFDKYRNITKSISCYALKLFTHHSNTAANTNNNNNNSCQQKCKKLSVESTGLTKSSFRTNDIAYDRKMFKQRTERKSSDRVKRNSSQRDIGTLKGYHQQMNESNLMPDTLTSTNKTSMSNNNHNNSTIQYRNSDAQSTDRVKCFNYRKAISKTSGIYGLFENLKSDHKIDKNSNMMYFRNYSHNERYYYELNNSMMNATIAGTGTTATTTTTTTTGTAGATTTTTTGTTITPNMCNFFRQPIFKASTGELLKYLSFFIVSRIQLNLIENSKRLHNSNSNLHNIQPSIIVAWIRSIDRALILQGWSEVAFINPTHIVFLYMMLKTFIENDHNIHTERELHTIIMACLYLAYSYIGNEISYPLRPFLIAEANQLISHSDSNTKKSLLNTTTEHAITSGSGTGAGATTGTNIESCLKSKVIDEVRNRFWQYVIRVVNEKSSDMLRINADPMLFTQMFKELTSYESIFVPMKLPTVNRNHKQ
ncbi:unnamed protein product [Trichobilharzia szidati]|nr:unnamed protein product [Trichobilharzia szidati]